MPNQYNVPSNFWSRYGKRIFDLFIASTALLLLAPVFILIAIWIKSESTGDIFFRQTRIGRFGIAFSIYKFRSMYVNSEQAGQLTIGSDNRITSVGRWLRRSKLDELPQLINVLLGDMSLVGPRPEVPHYVQHYTPAMADIILSIRPGITDRASLAHFDEAALLALASDPEQYYIKHILPQKCAMAAEYARKPSCREDLTIILKTAHKALRSLLLCQA